MRFIDDIFSFVWDISYLFYDAYLEVKGWSAPFSYLKTPLYTLYRVFWDLTTPIAQFGDWCDDVTNKVAQVLSITDIRLALDKWLDYAEDAWDWVLSSTTIINGLINTWWSTASQTVQVWVNDAKAYAQSLVATVSTALASLQVAWDSFKAKIPSIDAILSWWSNWTGNVLTAVNSWWSERLLDVQGLINSAFTTRESLWAGWQELRQQVLTFFQDPLEFIWARFTDWFLGPEG